MGVVLGWDLTAANEELQLGLHFHLRKYVFQPLVASLGSFCSTIELHPRRVGIIPGYDWASLMPEITGFAKLLFMPTPAIEMRI